MVAAPAAMSCCVTVAATAAGWSNQQSASSMASPVAIRTVKKFKGIEIKT